MNGAAPPDFESPLAERYLLEREIGRGGTARVYLARDLRHDRTVAVKVLDATLSAVVGPDRFLAEIRTTAKLHHPHILPLFDSGQADGRLFYVMPYAEGDSLKGRLRSRGPLPVDEAVRVATRVAEALQHAHDRGVIHRDVKPGNILLLDGQPMVADFGIALALDPGEATALTETGVRLGTPEYMSPEQAAGDGRVRAATDVYSLACVLHEMLVGEPPHTGRTAQAVLGKIVTGVAEPVTSRRPSIPENVAAAVAKGLEKLPADRFGDAGAFARALADPGFRHGATGRTTRRRGALSATLGTLVVAGTGLAAWALSRPVTSPVMRFTMALPEGTALSAELGSHLAQSPDGSTIVYAASGPGSEEPRLWVRRRDRLEARPLAGTDGARTPTFSPDGRRIAYMTSNPAAVHVIELEGGAPVTLASTGLQVGGLSWGSDGNLYLDVPAPVGLVRLPASGGSLAPFTALDTARLETSHNWPQVLPGGGGVIFTIFRTPVRDASQYEIAVADTDSGAYDVVLRAVYARYSRSGHLVYVTADGSLMAVRFDESRRVVTGAPVKLGQGVGVGELGSVDLAISEEGTLLYARAAEESEQIVLVDRGGLVVSAPPGWRACRGGGPGAQLHRDLDRAAGRRAADENEHAGSLRPQSSVEPRWTDGHGSLRRGHGWMALDGGGGRGWW